LANFSNYAGKSPVYFACFFKNSLFSEIMLEKFLLIYIYKESRF